jgi:ribose transport system ATP-binding protein
MDTGRIFAQNSKGRSSMIPPILKLEKVSKTFPGVRALDSVDFELRRGEVHVLVGENGAGKSTLIKLLSGVYSKDSGRFFIAGEEVSIRSVLDAQRLGIATIYQELNLAPNLSIAQNIFLGREPRSGKLIKVAVDRKACEEKSRELLSSLGLEVEPSVLVGRLSVPQRQMVEIAKALSVDARVVIFDEPTATLEEKETQSLFRIIRLLRDRGIGIVYISHRLEEIEQIGDRVTVLRDGHYIATVSAKDTSIDELIRMMVGRELREIPHAVRQTGDEAVKLESVCVEGLLHDVNLHIHKGEIVGLAGLVGAGRTELAEAIFGVRPIDAGRISLFGREARIASPRKASRLGMAFLTEDRKELGLFQKLSVQENIVSCGHEQALPAGPHQGQPRSGRLHGRCEKAADKSERIGQTSAVPVWR